MSLDNIKPILEEYGKLKSIVKEASARIKELDEELRPLLEGRGKITHAGYTFECKAMGGKKSLDKDALTAVLGQDLEPFYKKGKPYTMMKVEELKEI